MLGVGAEPRLILFTTFTNAATESGFEYCGFAICCQVSPGYSPSALTIEASCNFW
jgi:hypothetical protein